MGGLIAHILKQNRDDISEAILLNPTLNFLKILENFPREHICSRTGKVITITDEMANKINQLIPRISHNQNDYLLLLQKNLHSHLKYLILIPKVNLHPSTKNSHKFSLFVFINF